MRLILDNVRDIDAPEGVLIVDGFYYSEKKTSWVFSFRGRPVFSVDCDNFIYDYKKY